MEMGVDEAGRDEAAPGVDLFIHRLRIGFAHVLDPISVEYDDTVFDDFVFLAIEADNIPALYESFHRLAFQILARTRAGLTKDASQDKRPLTEKQSLRLSQAKRAVVAALNNPVKVS